MVYSLTWLPEVLESAGLKVAEQPGWRTRGVREMEVVKGVICHHTATPRDGNMPTLRVITDGRSDLRGPLSQLALGRDGTYYVVAAGLAQHAGKGDWRGIRTGNSNFIGIEAENRGTADDLWPDVQMDAYRRGVAAILAHIGAGAEMCCGHKEFALPHGRKNDPSFDMDAFRAGVAAAMSGAAAPRPLIPHADASGRETLRRGMRGGAVGSLQEKLSASADGAFGARTEAVVREFQRAHRLVPDGIVGPKTWEALAAG